MRELSGSLSKNERKTQEKHPDLRGSCLIGGKEYWISGWRKEGKGHEGASRIWYSLSFTAKEDKPRSEPIRDPEW